MLPNIANIAKNKCFPKNFTTFLPIFFISKFCHLLNYQWLLSKKSIFDYMPNE